MAKGKRAATVNAGLREKLRDAEAARRQLEQRVVVAEQERDAAIARVDLIEQDQHPAVTAAEMRVSAAKAEAGRIIADLQDVFDTALDHIVLGLDTGSSSLVYDRDGWVKLRGLIGPERFKKVFAGSGVELSRTQKRHMDAGPDSMRRVMERTREYMDGL